MTDEKTTYKMLKERVLQIAAALQKQGLQPGKSVAVDLPKGGLRCFDISYYA